MMILFLLKVLFLFILMPFLFYFLTIQLCLIWKYSVKGVSKKLYHIVHYFIITSFNLLMVTKVLTSCFNFRRPATYLIIASQIVRPSSIYQVGEPCISCMMLWKPDFCVNWHEILYKFTVNFIFQISGCLHFLVVYQLLLKVYWPKLLLEIMHIWNHYRV